MRIFRARAVLLPLVLAGSLLLPPPSYAVLATECQGQSTTIVGTEGDDDFQGTEGVDVVWLAGGNDRFTANGGDDVVCGGDGNDIVLLNGGGDVDVVAGPGRDFVQVAP